jgi:hypothetical protein
MSNYLAVSAVTETLRQILTDAFQSVSKLSAAPQVRTGRPEAGKAPFVGANLYMYRLAPNAALRNADLPTRDKTGHLVTAPVAAWDLYYLISFYGEDVQLEPQRLLGAALLRLHAEAILSPERIAGVVAAASPDSYLAESDLASQIEHVRLTPLALTLEELSKVWTVFFQTTHAISLAYVASPVLISGDPMPPLKEVTERPRPAATPTPVDRL